MCEPGGELQSSSGTLDEGPDENADWEDERETERAACEGEDFIPPKIDPAGTLLHRTSEHPSFFSADQPMTKRSLSGGRRMPLQRGDGPTASPAGSSVTDIPP